MLRPREHTLPVTASHACNVIFKARLTIVRKLTGASEPCGTRLEIVDYERRLFLIVHKETHALRGSPS